jgi:hypothetical protein
MQTMAIAKLKWAIGVLAIGGTFAVGTWGVAQGPGKQPGAGGGPPPTADSREEKLAVVERTADYAQRQRSLANLRKIMVAMHNYHDVSGRFPSDITDKAGKPILSWRVELLPFLDEQKLYMQFQHDQPWDSERNMTLLAKMPEVLLVGFEPKEATHTHYQRFAITGVTWGIVLDGAGGASAPSGGSSPASGYLPRGADGSGRKLAPPGAGAAPRPSTPTAPTGPRFPLKFGEVTDGLSNTLGVVEAGPAVPWTKPADVAYDAKKPLPLFAGPFTNSRNVAMMDGSTYSLKPDLDEKTLRHLIEPSDGNEVPALKTLRAQFAESVEEKKALAKTLEDNASLIATFDAQSKEFADLLRLWNKMTRDIDQAEDTRERLRMLLEQFKALNLKYRNELGIGPRGSIPKER